MFHRLLFLIGSLLLSVHAETVLKITDFGAAPDSDQDATEAFQKAIAAAKTAEKPVILDLATGRYDLFSTHAVQRACFYSNATEPGADGMRTIALDLSGVDHLTLRGNGSTLLMHGAMSMVVSEHSNDLVLSGLTFDFARPSVSEITALEKGDGFWIGQVHPDSLYQITEGHRILWKGEDWSSYHDLCQTFDPAQKTTWRSDDPTSKASAIEDLGERKLKFTMPPGELSKIEPGRVYQFRNVVRDQCGMWFSRCRNVAMTQVKVRAMRGFGILSQFTENVDFDQLEVGPGPDSGRTACSAADILHFSSCRGKIRIANSKLSAAHDDAVNVHGVHLRIAAMDESRQSLMMHFAHSQTWGYQAFEVGDVIEFVKPDTLLPFGTATVKVVEFQPGSHDQRIVLDRPAPANVEPGKDVVENVTWTPSVEITNCEVGQVPTRGFLLTTRQAVVVQHCRFFRIPMPCILVEDDARGWFESGAIRDMIVRDNDFFECASTPIQFSPQNIAHADPVHSNIRILNNDFTLRGKTAMDFKSTAGISVNGNRFHLWDGTTPIVESLITTQNSELPALSGNSVDAAK